MKRRACTVCLLFSAFLLSGCGGGQGTSGSTSSLPSGQSTPGPSTEGNWQFSTTPTVAGTPAIAIAGSLSQSGSSVSGALHVNGSNCFDPTSTVNLKGTLTDAINMSLTSTPVSGQVMTVTGTTTYNAFLGTYSISGGCANGAKGNVVGTNIVAITNTYNGTFTNSAGGTFDGAANIVQNSSASSDGSFGISGTATFQTSCFSSGTITSGKLSSGSSILGTSVTLVIDTGNGTLAFVGTEDLATSEISGSYTVAGGTCKQTGTAVLVLSNPWDY